jgi:hypothetical protein
MLDSSRRAGRWFYPWWICQGVNFSERYDEQMEIFLMGERSAVSELGFGVGVLLLMAKSINSLTEAMR